MRIMPKSLSRRQVLKRLGAAGAGVAFSAAGSPRPDAIHHDRRQAGRDRRRVDQPVDRADHRRCRSSGPAACRTTARWSRRLQGRRSAARADAGVAARRCAPAISPCASPPSRRRFTSTRSTGQPVQRLTLDADEPGLSFLLPKGPLLGLGEGGPQFDRKGIRRSRCATGRAAISSGRTAAACRSSGWSAPTAGGCSSISRSARSTSRGAEGRLTPAADALPLDVFVVASADPQGHHARVRAHHRTARSCRRCGRSATCSRTARSPGPTR